MGRKHLISSAFSAVAAAVVALSTGTTTATATEPCGDFGECKALIEINSSDGDIGFHFLMDGDDLTSARISDPNGTKIFDHKIKGPLKDQKITETFAESAEPLCFDPLTDLDPDNDDEDFVTLEEFLDRWAAGTYTFSGKGDRGEKSKGATELTYDLPAAPKNVAFDPNTGVISWDLGDDLGACATAGELDILVADGTLPQHPENVPVVAWEAVLALDLADGDPAKKLVFSIRVPGGIAPRSVTVPAEYIASLPNDTPAKVEVGALGVEDNATFSEVNGLCLNETAAGCP